MGKNKDPAVLFYTSDFLSAVSLMDMRERGQYITLLCLQRERGHLTMQEIRRAVKKPTDEVMAKFQQDETGRYFNARMDAEIEKRNAHCRKQAENIAKRWNKENAASGIPDGNTSGNTMVSTMVLPLGNGNGNRKEKVVISEKKRKNDSFTVFWDAYPRKVGKEAAKKAFAKVSVDLDTLLAALERQKNSAQWVEDGGRFIPNPSTWLNQGRWEDELPELTGAYHAEPGYGVQHHGDALTELEREAVARMMEETE